MKKYSFFTLLLLLASLSNVKAAQNSTTKTALFFVKTGKAELLADANFGARIISLKYNNVELLYGGYANPESSGSTLWPAPQKTWQWPPIDTLDSKPYSIAVENKIEKFISMPSEKSGYQMTKSFRANEADSSFILTYSIKNISTTIKNVGCWEVSRVFPGGITFFPAAPDSAVLKQTKLPGVTILDGIVTFKYDFKQIISNSKLFGNGSEGWYAHINNGIAFIKTFEDVASDAVAPGQGEIEVYANGTPRYVELENHGRYARLQPGESITYNVKWYVRLVPKNIQSANSQKELVDWVRKQIGVNK